MQTIQKKTFVNTKTVYQSGFKKKKALTLISNIKTYKHKKTENEIENTERANQFKQRLVKCF